MKTISYSVDTVKTERLDAFISSKSSLTRSFLQKLIRTGLVTVNNQKEKPGFRVRHGDIIKLFIPEQPEHVLIPENIPINILWEDEHIIVIDKPPHMVMYPAAGNRSGTLMNALAARCSKLASVGAPLRPGVMHRLDKDTSGVIVIAKDDASYHSLAEQFKNREVEKTYLALLYGTLKDDKGEITAAIGRSVSDRKKMSTRTRAGKEAKTLYEVTKRIGAATLAKVRIITGRTHQIRVHFASIGYPVLGDKTYGKKTALRVGQKIIKFNRQMLHAHSLKFRHPVNKEIMQFSSPMPEDMKEIMEALSATPS